MKKLILKKLIERVKYLESLIVKGDKNEIEDEASRIKGLPVKIDTDSDIRF